MPALLLALLLLARTALADDVPRGRLPDGVTPTHYALDLTIVPGQERFSGAVVIELTVAKPTNILWMHGQGLAVERATITNVDGTAAATWEEIANSGGVAKVTLARALPIGPAKLTIQYSAPFNRQLQGLYRADEGGESYIFSQMEPIDARRAFPSFDEPRFKTPFDIALTVREGHAAVSNAPTLREEKRPGGMKRVQFATTKPLPTYLVAVAVGPLDVVTWEPIARTALRNREIPLRGITAKGKGQQMRYALANTAPLLLALEDYFGIPYPYEKLDLIAAIDFSAGAMENAGAIVYRESIVLFEQPPSLAQRRSYTITHAHEMAHQWFGDLVTPAWWNDIWLNESFATWMETRIAATVEPKGEYGRLTVSEALGAMNDDSWRSARRIAEPVNASDDVANAFDSITYQKGGGVLGMFEQYYGADVFQKGVRLYLQRHAWGSATAEDFVRALADASGKADGIAAFKSFLNQPGVPILRTALACRKEATVDVRQSRYLRQPRLTDTNQRWWSALDRPREDQTWQVPLCIAKGDGQTRSQTCKLMTDRAASVRLGPQCPTWFLPNANGAGYWRFTLDDAGWKGLIAARDQLTETEVLAAVGSLDAAFTSGDMETADFLTRVRALLATPRGGDAMPVAWDVAAEAVGRLQWIRNVLADEGTRPAVEALLREIYGPWAHHLGIDATSDLDRRFPVQASLLRPTAISAAAVSGRDPALRAALAARAMTYLGMNGDGRIHPDAIDPDLVASALTVAVQDNGAAVARKIIELLRGERNGTTRWRLLTALTRATDPAVAAEVRALAFDPMLRINEVPAVVFGGLAQRETRAAAWEGYKVNFDAIAARLPVWNRADMAGVGAQFCTAKERDDFRRFFQSRLKDIPGARRTYASALEQSEACITLVAAQRGKLARAVALSAQP